MTTIAMKTVSVEVTKEDMKKGSRRVCWRCPVALAILRHVPLGISVIVRGLDVRFLDAGGYCLGDSDLPKEVSDWIVRFDDGMRSLRPFSFDLEVPA